MKRSFSAAGLGLLLCTCVDESSGVESEGGTTESAATIGESTGAADGSSESDASSDASSSGEQDGAELFAGLCAPCHGAEGEGTPLAYELRHPDREHSTWVVRHGRPGVEFDNSVMLAFGSEVVSDAQLEQIWDWLDAFSQPTTGEGLYLDYCRNCHGADAAGGASGKDIRDKELHDIHEKVRNGEGRGQLGVRGRYMPARGSDRLSDDEIEAVADYIAAL